MKVFAIGMMVLVLGCSSQSSEVHPDINADFRILFVGNSLTSNNNVPELVKEIGAQSGKLIALDNVLRGNYSLEDHWEDGIFQKMMDDGHYDFVVAQQGPSALPESQVLLLTYATRMANLCKEKNAKLAMYMVWPSQERSFDHDNVIYSYTQAALKTESLLCPAGLAWKYAWEADPSLALYASDLFHPSLAGSVLAALTIYGGLTGVSNFDFIKLDETSWGKGAITSDIFSKLKLAAGKALE